MKTNENGRSMIEMLGVLAIIGVLSVGGIAGYTSAMRSHRANEIVNATSMLFMLGLASNAGEGTQPMDLDSNLLPSGCTDIHYNGDGASLNVTITDEDVCNQVKIKLGDKAEACTAATGGATGYTLKVTLGEGEKIEFVCDHDPDHPEVFGVRDNTSSDWNFSPCPTGKVCDGSGSYSSITAAVAAMCIEPQPVWFYCEGSTLFFYDANWGGMGSVNCNCKRIMNDPVRYDSVDLAKAALCNS